jgi:hypothetical protein
MRVGEWASERGLFWCLRDVYLELTCRVNEREVGIAHQSAFWLI